MCGGKSCSRITACVCRRHFSSQFQFRLLLAKPAYEPFYVPIKGTEKRRLPSWMAELGFDREALTALTRYFHKEFKGEPLSQHSGFRLGINSQKLTHNQRNRLWQELAYWQEQMNKELADQDRRNDACVHQNPSMG